MNPIILWVSKSADSQARETMLLQAFSKKVLTLIPCLSELAVSSIREGQSYALTKS